MHRIDSAGATADNKFTEGDAATGVAATVVTDDWLNATQEEIAHVIEQTGGTLDKLSNTQLWAALSGWFAKGVQATETVLGIAKIATQAQTDAGTDDATIVTPKKLRFGFSASLTADGYIVLPKWLFGLIIQWGRVSIPAGGTASVTFPLSFPGACRHFSLTQESTTSDIELFNYSGLSVSGVSGVAVYTNPVAGGAWSRPGISTGWFAIGH